MEDPLKQNSEVFKKAQTLERYGFKVSLDTYNRNAVVAVFNSTEGKYKVTLRFLFNDRTGSDIVITNMTTLPEEQTGKGFGSQALQDIISWGKENNFKEIRATQVQLPSQKFWMKNGFVKVEGQNTSNDFILRM